MSLAPPSVQAAHHRALVRLDHHKDSPLDSFRFSVDRLKAGLAMFVGPDPIDELACRAGNKGAKTYNLAAYVLACLQKRPSLDGVPLPQWRGPVTGICLVIDHEQQKLSTQKHILTLLGRWPHDPIWKGQGILGELRIQPVNGNDDRSTWSSLTIMSQKNRASGVGARADIVWPDEPPQELTWREVRKAADAGRRIIRPMGFTPTIRRQWAWLRDEYGDSPRDTITRISQDWAECRWSLFDNKVLTQAETAKLLREYKKDALRDARIYGDYANELGDCPFDEEALHAMLAECVEPEIMEWRVPRESATGAPVGADTVAVEIFAKAKPGSSYYIPIDTSAGMEKGDPSGLHVREFGSGDLMARCVGAHTGYALGILSAALARQYNNAMVQPEVNDGWAVNVIKGLYDSHYGNIGKEPRELRPGDWVNELGFRTNKESRGAMVGAVQAWIESWRAGVRYARCPSRKVIECLLDCVLDETGKPVAAPGLHDEDLILWGQGLRKAVTRSGLVAPEVHARARTPEDRLIAAIDGSDEDHVTPFGQVAARPRRRARA